jgi:dihydroxyacetone kinase
MFTGVEAALDGLVACTPGLVRVDGLRVVVLKEFDRNLVSVISGGGAGHEPAHAGFVGKGLLRAAVVGDVFASPPVEAVLAGIRAVATEAGVLLVWLASSTDPGHAHVFLGGQELHR